MAPGKYRPGALKIICDPGKRVLRDRADALLQSHGQNVAGPPSSPFETGASIGAPQFPPPRASLHVKSFLALTS